MGVARAEAEAMKDARTRGVKYMMCGGLFRELNEWGSYGGANE